MNRQAHGADEVFDGDIDMHWSYYVFAAYVFLLICAVIWLLGRVLKKSKKASGTQQTNHEKEQKLFSLYQNVEDMLSSFEEYVEEAKSDTDKSMAKMQEMLEETRSLTEQLKTMQSSTPISVKAPANHTQRISEEAALRAELTDTIKADKQVSAEPQPVPVQPRPVPLRQTTERKVSKTSDKVAELSAQGFAQNEIARRLGISVREVTLALKIVNAEEVK
jgi:hypothetical protein